MLLKMQKLLHNVFMTSEIFVQCSVSLPLSGSLSVSALLLPLFFEIVRSAVVAVIVVVVLVVVIAILDRVCSDAILMSW